MRIVGYCFGIRSERRLCEEVHLNLAYRWFCRLDLADRVPGHSTFSKIVPLGRLLRNRLRAVHGRVRDSELLRLLFETTVARCIAEGLLSGQRMAIDAKLIHCPAEPCAARSRDRRSPASGRHCQPFQRSSRPKREITVPSHDQVAAHDGPKRLAHFHGPERHLDIGLARVGGHMVRPAPCPFPLRRSARSYGPATARRTPLGRSRRRTY